MVADATGADPYSRSAPTDPVSLDLPLLPGAVRVEAVVQRWSPIADDGTGDVAVLRLTRPAPPPARMPPLRRIDRLWDHDAHVVAEALGARRPSASARSG